MAKEFKLNPESDNKYMHRIELLDEDITPERAIEIKSELDALIKRFILNQDELSQKEFLCIIFTLSVDIPFHIYKDWQHEDDDSFDLLSFNHIVNRIIQNN